MAGIVQAICQYKKSQIPLTLQPDFDNLRGCVVFDGVIVDTSLIEVMHQRFGPFQRRCDQDSTTESLQETSQF